MMKFNIIPNEAVGDVLFGMTREEVRGILTGFKAEFKKSIYSENTTDDFGCCHVFYDEHNKCNAIEFFEKCELIYNDVNLFELSPDELKSIFPDMTEEYGSYCSLKSSIGAIFEEDVMDSILIGCKDYYC
ncbi:MAG: hypothetical protein UD936_03350 [Acutalibacteraceae bacterium]|nr:hypothetical protein [Acutalibacteraceae bacterium]